MAIELNKKTGINLRKGSTISLEKKGKKLEQVCIGLNWGVIKRIETSSFLGLFKTETVHTVAVDLDGSASMFAADGEYVDTVYYKKLTSDDGAVRHSGDDLVGDRQGNDDRDNEVIQINLAAINPRVHSVFLYVNSFKQQDFARIPYATIRLFEGTAQHLESVIATFNVASEPRFQGYTSMIMGKLIRTASGAWQCLAIGEPIKAKNIAETIETIRREYISL
jgi:tellurium resistance protein TerZ